MSDEPQKITKRQTEQDSLAIFERIKELSAQGYPYKQATAIALRQWSEGELKVIKKSTEKRTPKGLNILKTLAILSDLFSENKKEDP